MSAPVYFRLNGIAETLEIAPPAGEQAIFKHDDVVVTLELRMTPDRQESDDCLVVASVEREVADEVYREFELQLEMIHAEAARQPDVAGGVRFLAPSEVRWLIEPPPIVLAVCNDVRDELLGSASRLVRFLRWRFNRPWPAQPMRAVELLWSLDTAEWEPAPRRPSSPATFGDVGRELTDESVEIIERVWQAGEVAEPLARQIFLEAHTLADENPRASLVLAVAAAEVAIKQFAASHSGRESEAWLISKLPSPSIRVLLRDYMPFFTDKRTTDGRAVPRHLQSALHDAAEARNNIVHQGESGYDEEQLANVFVAVNDLLYLLDWFAGHEWAFAHLGDVTRAAYPE
jgi:hypothetical protein